MELVTVVAVLPLIVVVSATVAVIEAVVEVVVAVESLETVVIINTYNRMSFYFIHLYTYTVDSDRYTVCVWYSKIAL